MKESPIKNKICFVIPNYITSVTGGAELQVYLLIEEFLLRGYEIELLTLKSSLSKDSKYINPKIRHLTYSQAKMRFMEFFSVLLVLYRTSSYYYYQRTDYSLTASVSIFCKLKSRKMIYAIASDEDTMKNKYTSTFPVTVYTNLLKRYFHLFDLYLIDKLAEFGKRSADLVLCQTLHQQEQFLKNFKRESFMIRNSFSNLQVKDTGKKENIILWVGNLREIKQPEIFVQLAGELKFDGWEYIMIGEPDKDIQINSKTPVIENFRFLGPLNIDEVSDWFLKSKILVNTSRAEGFSNTFIQAWLTNTYVLSLNSDPDRLLNGRNFGYCANGSYQLFREKLIDCIDNGINSNYLTEANDFAQKEFSLVENVTKLEKLISTLG